MRVLYKNGLRFEADFVDHTGRPFRCEIRCPMAWSHGQSNCSELCAWYSEGISTTTGGKTAVCLALKEAIGEIWQEVPSHLDNMRLGWPPDKEE